MLKCQTLLYATLSAPIPPKAFAVCILSVKMPFKHSLYGIHNIKYLIVF